MGINKEYRCLGHGAFESADEPPVCPHGCTAVERQFRTPVGYIGQRSKNIDDTYQKIANDFGLSDMNTHGGTTAARVLTKQQKEMQDLQEKLRPRFGQVPKGGTYDVGARQAKNATSTGGALGALAAEGAPETTVLSEVKPHLPQHRIIGKRDPDKGSIAKVKTG